MSVDRVERQSILEDCRLVLAAPGRLHHARVGVASRPLEHMTEFVCQHVAEQHRLAVRAMGQFTHAVQIHRGAFRTPCLRVRDGQGIGIFSPWTLVYEFDAQPGHRNRRGEASRTLPDHAHADSREQVSGHLSGSKGVRRALCGEADRHLASGDVAEHGQHGQDEPTNVHRVPPSRLARTEGENRQGGRCPT